MVCPQFLLLPSFLPTFFFHFFSSFFWHFFPLSSSSPFFFLSFFPEKERERERRTLEKRGAGIMCYMIEGCIKEEIEGESEREKRNEKEWKERVRGKKGIERKKVRKRVNRDERNRCRFVSTESRSNTVVVLSSFFSLWLFCPSLPFSLFFLSFSISFLLPLSSTHLIHRSFIPCHSLIPSQLLVTQLKASPFMDRKKKKKNSKKRKENHVASISQSAD